MSDVDPIAFDPTPLLRTRDLADRWQLREDTIRKWRSQGRGPGFLKFDSGIVRYRPVEVDEYERLTGLAPENRP